ncbi:hypothetical protein OG249_20245 [Streptomyces microflavus]|uniref:hypothetical protein n=1 Tax=Streptomyces microflavus TaxID=1919 RepID=UPI00224F9F81|nr:hypothetical protein [Streptomyces microflavus]MCX4654206.1 hypothetical protein [Streptomyces microflavus]
MSRDDLCFDFGLTGLGGSFHGDWVLFAVDQWDHVTQWYGPPGADRDKRRLLLRDDVRRLLDCALVDAELNTLWRLTDSDALDGSPEIGGQERVWLERTLTVAEPYGPGEAVLPPPGPCALRGGTPEPDSEARSLTYEHRMLADDVKELIGLLDPRQQAVGATLPEARAALTRCVDEVCSEIAFRFLLHGFEAFGSFVSQDLYGQLERVGERFRYGPHVVDRLHYLVS